MIVQLSFMCDADSYIFLAGAMSIEPGMRVCLIARPSRDCHPDRIAAPDHCDCLLLESLQLNCDPSLRTEITREPMTFATAKRELHGKLPPVVAGVEVRAYVSFPTPEVAA